jgi:hypothetical protein
MDRENNNDMRKDLVKTLEWRKLKINKKFSNSKKNNLIYNK